MEFWNRYFEKFTKYRSFENAILKHIFCNRLMFLETWFLDLWWADAMSARTSRILIYKPFHAVEMQAPSIFLCNVTHDIMVGTTKCRRSYCIQIVEDCFWWCCGPLLLCWRWGCCCVNNLLFVNFSSVIPKKVATSTLLGASIERWFPVLCGLLGSWTYGVQHVCLTI